MTLAHLHVCGAVKASAWSAYALLGIADLRVAFGLVPIMAVLTLATFLYDEHRRRRYG